MFGERRAHGVDDRAAGEVLARDQLEAVLLAAQLAVDDPRHGGIGVTQRRVVIETHPCSWSIFATRRLCLPPANSVCQPRLQDLDALVLAHEPRRQDQHVGVVVLPRQPGDLGRPRHRRPDARVPVGGVRHAQPRAAEQHPASRIVPLDASRHRVGKIGIVDGLGTGGAQVERLVPEGAELLDQPRLQLDAGMVRSDGNDFRHPVPNV